MRYAAAIALRNSILSNRNWARKSNELYDDSHACFPDADKLFIKAHIIGIWNTYLVGVTYEEKNQ